MELICKSCLETNEGGKAIELDEIIESLSKSKNQKDEIHDNNGESKYECVNFCKASWRLSRILRQCGTQHGHTYGLARCLHLLLDIIRIDPCYRCCLYFLELRFHIPFVMLTLGMDQVCYDFIRWSLETWPLEQAVILGSVRIPTDPWPWPQKIDLFEDCPMLFAGIESFEEIKDPIQKSLSPKIDLGVEVNQRALYGLPLALIKLRNVKRMKETAKFELMAFLMGTHDRLGMDSPVLKLKNQVGVLGKIFDALCFHPERETVRRSQYEQVYRFLRHLKKEHPDFFGGLLADQNAVSKVMQSLSMDEVDDLQIFTSNKKAKYCALLEVGMQPVRETPWAMEIIAKILAEPDRRRKVGNADQGCCLM